MRAPTHITFISSCYFLLSAAVSYPIDATHLAILWIGSVLPDIDYPKSWVGMFFFFISERIEKHFGHRTITHSALGCVILGLISLPLFFLIREIYYLLLIGYFSHIALDMWNKTGVPFLWPLKRYSFVIPKIRPWRIEVGSRPEMVVLLIFLITSVVSYQFQGMGFSRILHLTTKNISGAKEGFIKYSSSNFTTLKGKFRDNTTFKIIEAEYPVVAAYKEGLIIRNDSHLKLVSKSDTGHLYPLSVFLEVNDPMQIIAPKVNLDGRTIGDLIRSVDKKKEHYIIGEAIPASKVPKIPNESDAYNPLQMSGEKIKFQYATIEDLKPFSSILLRQGEAIIQYRLKLNEELPTINSYESLEKVIETSLKISVKDLDSVKVAVGDVITKGQLIAQDPTVQNQIERKESELEALEANWIAEKLRIKTRNSGLKRNMALIPTDSELERLRNIMSANDIERKKQQREQLMEEIELLAEQLRAEEEAYKAKKKKLEVDINQLQDKMNIESPVSGKVASIRLLNITGDKANVEILIISKDPFQKSNVASAKRPISNKTARDNKNKIFKSNNILK